MTASASPRRSRFWLYAPFVLLALIAAGWTGFWFVVRGQVARAVDTALAREAGLGRSWTCADRSIEGFPFRVELRCSSLSLTSARWGEAVKLQTGPALAVGQIYSPGLVILQVTGPLQVGLPQDNRFQLGWAKLEASLAHRNGDPERISIVVAEPSAVLAAPGQPDQSWRAAEVELHLRRDPARPAAEQAVDLAISATGSVLPALDALLGTTEPGNVEIQAVATQSDAFRIGLNPDSLEAWRNAGGRLELTRLVSVKGPARIEATGQFLIDQTHRVSGQIQAAVAGITQVGGINIGGGLGALGSLLGGGRAAPSATPGLTPLPGVVIREGRFYMGPLRLPLQPLPPLY